MQILDFNAIAVSVTIMVALGFFLSVILAAANAQLYVFEDPRIERIEDLLPGSNCGACGLPGCSAFAGQVVEGAISPGSCTVSSDTGREEIADLLGVDVGGAERQVARLACAGGSNVARQRARYEGLQTCRAANLVAGGGKGCAWGCLGYGECRDVCDFDAIEMDPHELPLVDETLCTACGDCVEICPKNLFSLQPVSNRLWVACANEAIGDEAEAECEVVCNACGRCAADAPSGVISMIRNLAVVNYDLNALTHKDVIQRCPTGAIVWLTRHGEAIRGVGAKPVVRNASLPLG